MRIRLVSDVHLEMPINAQWLTTRIAKALMETGHPSEEVLVLAGDIGSPFSPLYEAFIREMAKMFAAVVVTMGNHEYYQPGGREWDHEAQCLKPLTRHTMQEADEQARRVIAGIPRAVLLQKDAVEIMGVRFVGCTMWSPGDPFTEGMMNDGRLIPGFDLSARERLHNDHVAWLKRQLALPRDVRLVVVTHHLPTYSLISPEYANHPGNSFFAARLDHLARKADVWICGHTHRRATAQVGACLCAVNPVGYKDEVPTFLPSMHIDV